MGCQYTMMWMLRALLLVTAHGLFNRVQIHGWRNGKIVFFFCFVHKGERFWKWLLDYFGFSRWKPRKNFSMSYLQGRNMKKTEAKRVLDNFRMPKLLEILTKVASRDSQFCKMFSRLFCRFAQVKALENFSEKLYTIKVKKKRRSRGEK